MEECNLKYCGYNRHLECTKHRQRESCVEQSLMILRLEEWEIELLMRLVENKLTEASMHLFLKDGYVGELKELLEKLREGMDVCRHRK